MFIKFMLVTPAILLKKNYETYQESNSSNQCAKYLNV